MSAQPVPVLYLGGYSRSGSTLFDRMLGQMPASFVSTGELSYIWTHGALQNRLCGCGRRFSDCDFWRRVGEEAFGGWSAVDAEAMLGLYRHVNRHRYLPLLVQPRLSRTFERDLRAYGDVLSRLYRAIRDVSGARVVVDSSIDPSYCYLLRHVPGLDLRVVHFVRDSRGTAFSWTRDVVRSDVVDREVHMRRFPPAVTAVRWSLYHALLHGLERLGVPSTTVRYEDVVDHPNEQVLRVADFLEGALDRAAPRVEFGEGVFELAANHTVAGNRVRLQRGAVPVRVDDEWRRALPLAQQGIVTLLSWPLLRRYGYVGGRHAAA